MKITEAQLLASVCRKSFKRFIREFASIVLPGGLTWNWHIEEMADYLQDIAERVFRGEAKLYDFVCNISPGSTKSTVFSVLFPAWVWTRMPHAQVIGASYSKDLAMELARKCRDVVLSDLYRAVFPEVVIRDDQSSKSNFVTTKGGKRYAVGAAGTVTGMHADFIIIDDPLDPLRAVSSADLNTINYWIKNTLSSRVTDKKNSVSIMVMQRLHQNDPTALFLEKKRVRHLCLPATLEGPVVPKELANKYVDGLMDPVRLPKEFLDEARAPGGIGEYGYASQYLQTPVPAGGGMFQTDKVNTGPRPSRFRKVVRFWDKAATPQRPGIARQPAFTVGLKMGRDLEDRVWVLHVVRVRVDSATREALIKKTAALDGPGVVVGIEQEPGSGGIDSALGTVRRLAGHRVRILKAQGSKEIRADEFSVAMNSGMVWIPSSMKEGDKWIGWAKDYIDEMKHWPHSTFKDQGDASGGAFTLACQATVHAGPLRRKKALKRPDDNRPSPAKARTGPVLGKRSGLAV